MRRSRAFPGLADLIAAAFITVFVASPVLGMTRIARTEAQGIAFVGIVYVATYVMMAWLKRRYAPTS